MFSDDIGLADGTCLGTEVVPDIAHAGKARKRSHEGDSQHTDAFENALPERCFGRGCSRVANIVQTDVESDKEAANVPKEKCPAGQTNGKVKERRPNPGNQRR